MFLAATSTLLRCFVRIRILKAFGLDDYLMVAALTFYIMAESFVFDAVRVTHDKTLVEEIPVLSRALRSMYLGEVFYTATVWTLKLSIGAFLLRLVMKPVHKYVIIVTLVVVSLYSTAYILMVIFQCTPVDHFWHEFGKGKCIPGKVNTYTSYAHAAIIGASDLILAIVPVFMVWNLQMNQAMKLSVGGLLSLGALGGITTFIRMPYIKALGEATVLNFFEVTSRLAIWTCVEPGVGIFVGSLAALRPLFRRILGGSGIFSGPSNPTSNSQSHSNSRYWQSSRSDQPYHMESFSGTGKRSVTTTVVEGMRGKKQKLETGNDSDEEALTMHKTEASISDGGIQRTVEFMSSASSRNTATPTGEEAFKSRGGFY